jgi:hypothetical protein
MRKAASVSVLCKSYMSESEAQRAVSSLLEAGVPGSGVRVLMGEAVHDARKEPFGEFGGTESPDAPVGSFGNEAHTHAESMGDFASEGAQRGGSFGDVDRDTVASYPEGVERVRIASHHNLKKTLTDAGLDEDAAERDVRALHEGRVLVLAEITGVDRGRAQELLDSAES